MALSCNESSLTDDGPNGAFAPRRKSMGSKSNRGNQKRGKKRGKREGKNALKINFRNGEKCIDTNLPCWNEPQHSGGYI